MPAEPTLAEVIREAITSRLLDLHTALPGRIHKYYPDTQTADIVPVIRRAVPARAGGYETEELPLLPNVPVVWPRGGGFALHFPIAKGDHVLVCFSEADTSPWRENFKSPPDGVFDPGDLRRHNLSYGFAIPGVGRTDQALTDAPASDEAVVLVPSGGTLRVSTPGAVSVEEVVLFEKLKTALLQAISTAALTVVPADGGAAVLTSLTNSITAWTPELLASGVLKAE